LGNILQRARNYGNVYPTRAGELVVLELNNLADELRLPHACRGIGDRVDDVDFVKLEKKEQKWDIG